MISDDHSWCPPLGHIYALSSFITESLYKWKVPLGASSALHTEGKSCSALNTSDRGVLFLVKVHHWNSTQPFWQTSSQIRTYVLREKEETIADNSRVSSNFSTYQGTSLLDRQVYFCFILKTKTYYHMGFKGRRLSVHLCVHALLIRLSQSCCTLDRPFGKEVPYFM